jgi:hypothetical protein
MSFKPGNKKGEVKAMYKYAGSDVIVKHITKYGPKKVDELCQALGLRQPTAVLYLRQPIAEAVLVFDKVPKAGSAVPVRRYRLPTQPKYDPTRPEAQRQSIVKRKAEAAAKPKIGKVDPLDPFGLVARMARGEKVDLPNQ